MCFSTHQLSNVVYLFLLSNGCDTVTSLKFLKLEIMLPLRSCLGYHSLRITRVKCSHLKRPWYQGAYKCKYRNWDYIMCPQSPAMARNWDYMTVIRLASGWPRICFIIIYQFKNHYKTKKRNRKFLNLRLLGKMFLECTVREPLEEALALPFLLTSLTVVYYIVKGFGSSWPWTNYVGWVFPHSGYLPHLLYMDF